MALLESRIAFIRDLAQRGGIGATLAARDAAMIVELALRELLRRHAKELPSEGLVKVEQAIAQQAKGGRGKTVGDFTLGQLVGVIRESRFFDLWADATGKPLMTLRMINLDALNAFRNKHLTHVADFEQLTDPAEQVSPGTAQFLLHCVDELVKAFGIESLENLPSEPGPADIAQLPDIGQSPYVGLRPFEARHHDLFFGREQESEELYQQVLSQPFVALIGNSGSGKSSLLGAGLLPRLPAADWCVISLQPRTDLFDSLAASLVPVLYPDPAEQAAQRDKLARLLGEPDYRLDHLLHSLAGPRRVLLLVDQFEEVFTLSADRTRQRRVVELLLTLLRGDAMTLLLSLRADYFGRCLDIDPLRQTLTRWPALTLGAMGEAALLAAITRPAERSGLSLEDGLAETIIEDLGDEPGQLPLLQTALDELWQRSDRRKLTHAGYRAIGGVAHALARKADEFLARYDTEGQDRLRRIFLQLIRPGEGEEDTRQLATESQVGAGNWELVAQLASALLVVTGRIEQNPTLGPAWSPKLALENDGISPKQALDSKTRLESIATAAGETTVELAHEALIRHWQTLRGWIAENRAFRLWQNKLRDSRAEWAGHAQDDGYLLRGAKLLEAEERLAEKTGWLAEDEKAFIAASAALRLREADEKERQRRERERLQQRVLHTVAAALVVAFGLTGVAGWQWRVAEGRKEQAEANLLKMIQAANMLNDIMEKISMNTLLGNPLDTHKNLQEIYEKQVESLYQVNTENPIIHNTLELTRTRLKYFLDKIQSAGNKERDSEILERVENLAYSHPNIIEYTKDLAELKFAQGYQEYGQGHTTEGDAAMKNAIEIYSKLTQEHPEDPDNLRRLDGVYFFWANKYPEKKRDVYQQTIELREAVAAKYPNNTQYQKELLIGYLRMAVLIHGNGDSTEEESLYRKGLAVGESLWPANADVGAYLSLIAESLAIIERRSGRETESQASLDRAKQIEEQISRQYPEQMGNLFQNQIELGNLLLGAEQMDEAENLLTRAISRAEQVGSRFLNEPSNFSDMMRAHETLANVYQAKGDLKQAEVFARKAIQFGETIKNISKDDPRILIPLSQGYVYLGDILYSLDRISEAMEIYRKAIGVDEILRLQNPLAQQYRDALIMALGKVSWVGILSGNTQEAIAAALRALKFAPNMNSIKGNLAHGYLLSGQLSKAQAIYMENKDNILPEYGNKSFVEAVFEDFRELRKKGITHPDMAKIEKLLHEGRPP